MDAVFISQVSVDPKRHIPKIVKQIFVCPGCEPVPSGS